MLQKLKFNDPSKQVWIGSDLHIHHDRGFIFEPRGFTSVKEHDEWIINDINSLVSEDDIFIHLGDIMLNSNSNNDFENLLRRIKCKNIVHLFGNHHGPDGEFYKRKLKEQKNIENAELYPFTPDGYNITFLGNYAEVEINKKNVTLSHFPFSIFNKSHHSNWNLSGHSHGTNPNTLPDCKTSLVLDCGVDACKKYWNHSIFSWKIIQQIMKNKTHLILDHHGKLSQ